VAADLVVEFRPIPFMWGFSDSPSAGSVFRSPELPNERCLMTKRIGLCVLITCFTIGSAAAQQQPARSPAVAARQTTRGNPPPAGGQTGAGRQPAQPQHAPNTPTLQRRQAQATAPFQLTPQQQALVDRMLTAWERESTKFRKFACDFTRYEYDAVFSKRDEPRFVDLGYIKYAAPDKGAFRVTHTQQNGRVLPIEPRRAEHWICDGSSVYGYDFVQEQLVEAKLPPELQGKAIANGPLPFLFGAQAQRLKQRYWIRDVTPRDEKGRVLSPYNGQVWLEAYPRYQADAANFKRAELILTTGSMEPFALQLHLPGGQQRTVYRFSNIQVNARDPADLLDLFPDRDFSAQLPAGWKRVVEEAEPARAAERPASRPRR
jgi:TIGR03009 family protein